MKKILLWVLAGAMMLSLAACGKSEAAKAVDDQIAAIGEVTLESETAISEAEAAVDALAAAGVINSPERWKALDYTANTVRLLIIKMGQYVAFS